MGAFEYEGKEVPVVNTCRIKHNEKWKYANSKVATIRYWPAKSLCYGHLDTETCSFVARTSFIPKRPLPDNILDTLFDFVFSRNYLFIATTERIERISRVRSGISTLIRESR